MMVQNQAKKENNQSMNALKRKRNMKQNILREGFLKNGKEIGNG